MSFSVSGIPQLQRRLAAVNKATGRTLLQQIQLDAVREANLRVPRKTGHLGRSIRPGGTGRDYTIVKVTAGYAAFVEFGTKPHIIRPRNGSVLAWPAAGSARLSGSTKRGGSRIFARVVHHPGTKPEPYLVPAAQEAIRKNMGAQTVIRAWNNAA